MRHIFFEGLPPRGRRGIELLNFFGRKKNREEKIEFSSRVEVII
jgi:hypothetical protein